MPENHIIECRVAMRDGVELYTIIQLPKQSGKFPTIIKRNPYCVMETDFDALKNENTHGYAVVTQHCRGTAKSDGVCQVGSKTLTHNKLQDSKRCESQACNAIERTKSDTNTSLLGWRNEHMLKDDATAEKSLSYPEQPTLRTMESKKY